MADVLPISKVVCNCYLQFYRANLVIRYVDNQHYLTVKITIKEKAYQAYITLEPDFTIKISEVRYGCI
ncbi:MAG: hypothetical protein COW76_06240 [Shewanella sp. CG18_big_fil_WC_8_21_14_2_50_42_11]|jgi:hypothetical protein|nr:MAG: hypothetical protein COW76_06240 [Shewanella sp. CG18_big_fil_WC_8_21_14_2_50_42_11]PIX72397.1 MAG: hypothetical protein COZ42_05815 [Shewanella sp. CG_4_10_14_3_um_filter_42_91]PIY66795.1 MAG: hypothetical protein COY92_08835 [Shewanella sp. CG_4_10_14_0_8_um_filter_42_13]PJB92728.1 MAG: hypothetical protein CO084_03110 [Shewanella sp. CG_4_9_14_0_8_um_filter_42_14]|tara:strand:+ start:498 stop:701 length:204 start_codon:yes stop_codon:yes gene_type:complete